MGELTPQDRLQPFLLDRITDEQPAVQKESRERRIMSGRDFRRAVLRDLQWLLNAGNPPPSEGMGQFPRVADSVVNFGMRDLAGTTSTNATPDQIEEMVRQAILTYEPRILPETLKVSSVKVAEDQGSNVVQLEIRGEVWNLPVPEHLYIRTEVDLETGRCELKEEAGR